MFYLNLRQQGNVLYAHLEGNLCHKTASATYKAERSENKVCENCDDKVERKTKCSKLRKMDLDGKYALLSAKIEMKKNGGNFLLCNMKKSLKEGLIGFHFKIMN